MRIVSLISSGTEILYRLGLEKNLVGISHECDFPPSLVESPSPLPRLSKPRLDPTKKSIEIHEDLIGLLKKSLSIYEIDAQLLAALEPDLIVTQDVCDVCAVSFKDVEKAVCSLTKKNTQICSLRPHTLDDIPADFRRLGKATNRNKEAEELVTWFWIELNKINATAGTHGRDRSKVVMLEWLDPTIVAGGWIPHLVELAGADPLIVTTEEKFKTVNWDDVYEANPDYVVILPCGYPMEKTLGELQSDNLQSRLLKIPAVQNGNCFVVDGNQYFNRPGPRIVDSCEILAAIFAPTKFPLLVEKHLNHSYTNWRSGKWH